MPTTARELMESDGHRPWPLPSGPWVMFQRWIDLIFMHWPVDYRHLRTLVPSALTLDTFEGQAWLGVAPFEVSGLRMRGLPPIPGLSRFPELNVRTYVTVNGKPGVFFFSLDAGSRAAVAGARLTYSLPYFRARMSIDRKPHTIRYACTRTDGRAAPASFRANYGPSDDLTPSRPGSLDHWLTERYCLYAVKAGRVFRAEVHHLPWPLQPADAEIQVNTMASSHGIQLPDAEPLLHFARRLDVLVWPPFEVR